MPEEAPGCAMANGYASNIPLENLPPEPELLSEDVCLICKKRQAVEARTCAACARKLAEGPST